MSESTAKLKVTVKLHQQPLTEMPELTPPKPAPLSAARLAVAVLVILLAAYGGRWLYQQWPHNEIDYAAYAAPKDDPATSDEVVADVQPRAAALGSPTQMTSANQEPKSLNSKSLKTASAETPVQVSIAKPQQSAGASAAAGQTSVQPLTQATAIQSAKPAQPDSAFLPTGFRRIVLTAQMERLEPGAAVAEPVPFASVKRVYLFTEIEGFAGQHLRHRWYWNNQFQYEARLTVEDSPWRTYSEKWLLDDQRGTWRVEIVDQAQNVLYQHDFTYQ